MFKRLISLTVVLSCILLPMSLVQAQDGIDWDAELGDWSGETLNVLMIGDPWVTAFDEINPGFEDLTGAEVIVDAYGYDATHEKEVLVGTSESSDYDVIVLDAPWVGEFAEGGFVEDLTPYIEATDPEIIAWNDFMPSFVEVVTWEDQIVGIPFGPYVLLSHYRTDLFEEAGLEPAETIPEFIAAAETLTGDGVYGAAMNYQRGSPVGQAYFEYIYAFGGKPFESMYPGSPDAYADMTPLLDSPESIAVVQFFKDMLEYVPVGAENMAWDERATLFATGQVAMVNAWTVRTPGFANPEQSIVTDRFATAMFPHAEGAEPSPPLGGWLMGINQYSVQKDMAWDYIKWFTSQETLKDFVLAGGPPARLSHMEDPDILADQPWVATVAESHPYTYADCRPRIPESSEIITTIGNYVSQAVVGEMSVEEAMQAADEDIATLLRNAGYVVNQ
ncbi:extracellular solute-binding protein [candidate division KSB3 bacterium]|nr:extracellular solute-binding protein [candidate division KSB3 bacterium]